MKKSELYRKAIKTWGEQIQMILAIEEMAELTKALTKCIRGESGWWEMLITEMTDVEIMLEQIKEMFVQLPQEIETNKKVKLQRLKDRLGINE